MLQESNQRVHRAFKMVKYSTLGNDLRNILLITVFGFSNVGSSRHVIEWLCGSLAGLSSKGSMSSSLKANFFKRGIDRIVFMDSTPINPEMFSLECVSLSFQEQIEFFSKTMTITKHIYDVQLC